MKVAVIGFNNLKYSPYIKTYTDILDKYSVEYDVIIPDRNGLQETSKGNLIKTEWDTNKNKILNFAVFAKEVRKILIKNKYDFVFVLTTLPAILLSTALSRKYKGRYLVDIRDYTYDKTIIFKYIEAYVLKNAHTRVISSPAFKDFLPNAEYTLCHNFSCSDVTPVETFDKREDPIKIGYVGSVSYVDECKRLIDLVKNDERFSFSLYGNEVFGTVISDYVANCGIQRIEYLGGYEPSEKKSIIENVDILFNDYGNDSDLVRCALSNKLYDSFVFKKPLITSPNTIMSKLADDYSFDIDDNTKDLNGLYEWYVNINGFDMVSYMNNCLEQFKNDNLLFEEKILGIIGGNL